MATERYPSGQELDLKRRLDPDHTPDSVTGATVTVQPNPQGEDDYVGTDPIYQGRANKTEQPLAAKSGVEKKAEQAFLDQFDLSDVDHDEVVEDFGMGGEARKAAQVNAQPDVPDVVVGQSADVTHRGDDAGKQAEIDALKERVEKLEGNQSDSGQEDPGAGEPEGTDGGVSSPASPAPAPPTTDNTNDQKA